MGVVGDVFDFLLLRLVVLVLVLVLVHARVIAKPEVVEFASVASFGPFVPPW
jgi:hypothetical protein